jgi:GNAT superfamily N-acetyltransferase
VAELIKYWLGITELEVADFDFGAVEIKTCTADDYKLLLSKYHYLPNAGRGGIAYGAYLNGVLIAVCIFSPMVRQNLPWDNKNSRELSRLCIHPRHQKKNFASWFVSRCIHHLDPKYKTIISYCDTTFNHDGAIYKACNFSYDGDVPADYWYASDDGWIMHKKTLYGHAKKMSMTEADFADLHGYKKIYGRKKLRFIYER